MSEAIWSTTTRSALVGPAGARTPSGRRVQRLRCARHDRGGELGDDLALARLRRRDPGRLIT